MKWLDNLIDKWNAFLDKVSPYFWRVGRVFRTVWRTLRDLWRYMFWFRSIVLGMLLGCAAVIVAGEIYGELPETLTLTVLTVDAEATNALFGLFVMTQVSISRNLAVMIPMGLTAACILLMIFSKRMLYPFMIGLLTLTLPYIIYFFTLYPM